MKINLENVQALVGSAYIHHVRSAFGEAGERGIINLLDIVKLIYRTCPPERIKGTLTVVRGIHSTPFSPAIGKLGHLLHAETAAEAGSMIVNTDPECNIFVECVADSTFRLAFLSDDIDLVALASSSIVYRFRESTEEILAKDYRGYVPKISSGLMSNFAVPTQSGLEEAFKTYAQQMALESQCQILKEVWEGGVDGPRLVLKNKPESIMRDSLVQALRLLTRDTNVRPEQNTDETKPVDIRIDWFGTGASALIEIKWLGKSTAISRRDSKDISYTEYSNSRAQDGAKQLADYMDREVRHSNSTAPRGYLVVFDARRKGLKGAEDKLSKGDAQHYERESLVFNPDFSIARNDFATPVRMFMRARESHFSA